MDPRNWHILRGTLLSCLPGCLAVCNMWSGEKMRKKDKKNPRPACIWLQLQKNKKGLQPDVPERAAELAAWLASCRNAFLESVVTESFPRKHPKTRLLRTCYTCFASVHAA
jgi:hypothetical protein